MSTRQGKREKESKIVEAARAALYHQLLMWDQQNRLERLIGEGEDFHLENLMTYVGSSIDTPTEALTISSSVIREALYPAQKDRPEAEED